MLALAVFPATMAVWAAVAIVTAVVVVAIIAATTMAALHPLRAPKAHGRK